MRTTWTVVFSLIFFAFPALAQNRNYTLATASPGGFWQVFGPGLDGALRASLPGTSVTTQTSGGGLANVMLVSQKKADMGMVHSAELRIAAAGKTPFKAPVTNLRVLARLYDNAAVHLVVTKAFAEKHGIKSISDIATKKIPVRIGLNRPGNIVSASVISVFEAAGITVDNIKSWGGEVVYAGSSEQMEMLRDRRLDMVTSCQSVPASAIVEASNALDIVLLDIGEALVQKLTDKEGSGGIVIAAKSSPYPWQPYPVTVSTLSASLVVNADMPDTEAYSITKAIIGNIDKLRAVHPGMKDANPTAWSKEVEASYHPGAVRAYGEGGINIK